MKDSEFIELLNLYLDHEITAEQSARLETEVAANQQRRKLYREYCMLAKGCSLLGGAFAEHAPERPLAEAPSRAEVRSFWGWSGGFYGAGLMAAACLVAVFVVRVRHSAQPASQAMAAAAPAAAVPVAHASTAMTPAEQRVLLNMPQPVAAIPASLSGTPELHTVLFTRPWASPAPEQLAALADGALAWMDDVNLTPLQMPKLQTLPLLPLPPAATRLQSFGSQEQVQLVGWQFQR